MLPTFKQYLLDYQHVDSPFGEFACNVIADSEFPLSEQYTVNHNYLSNNGNNEIVIEMFERLFTKYKKIIDTEINKVRYN